MYAAIIHEEVQLTKLSDHTEYFSVLILVSIILVEFLPDCRDLPDLKIKFLTISRLHFTNV